MSCVARKERIAGQKHAVQGVLVAVLGGDIQADQRLAGARYASDEADRLAAFDTGVVDDPIDRRRGTCQIDRAGVAAGNVLDRMTRVERTSGFDDRRRRLIAPTLPGIGIESRAGEQFEYVRDARADLRGAGTHGLRHQRVVGAQHDAEDHRFGLGGDQHRCDRNTVTGLMEVAQIKGVIPDLIDGGAIERRFAHFEFDDEHHVVQHQQHIDPLAQARNRVLEVDAAATFQAAQRVAQQCDLLAPGEALFHSDGEAGGAGKQAEDRFR